MQPTIVLSLLGCVGLAAAPLRAQAGDPRREIQEIARLVDEQLQEIDRLLLESSRKSQARAAGKDLLARARERSQVAEDGIDKLIDKLQQMKNQGGGGSSSDSQQQDQSQDQQGDRDQQSRQNQQGRQQPQNRRENQTPDIAPRPQQEPGGQPEPGRQQDGQNQQNQPQGTGAPQGGQEQEDLGQNTRGNRQPEPETGPGNPGTGDQSWGELQPYLNFLRNRGSNPPPVPEKFRRHWEAYLKNTQRSDTAPDRANGAADPNRRR